MGRLASIGFSLFGVDSAHRCSPCSIHYYKIKKNNVDARVKPMAVGLTLEVTIT